MCVPREGVGRLLEEFEPQLLPPFATAASARRRVPPSRRGGLREGGDGDEEAHHAGVEESGPGEGEGT